VKHVLRACVFCLLWFPPPGQAQDTTYIASGTRIRVLVPERTPVAGELMWLRNDSLAVIEVKTGARHAFALTPDVAIKVFDGRRRAVGSSARYGALIGGLMIGVAGVESGDACGADPYQTCSVLAAFAGGALAGAALGGLVGSVLGLIPRDRWRTVSPPWAIEP
jgi:hypothetical protein